MPATGDNPSANINDRLRHDYFRNGTVPVVYPIGFKSRASAGADTVGRGGGGRPLSPPAKHTDVTLLERGLLVIVLILSILCALVVLLLLRASSMEAKISRDQLIRSANLSVNQRIRSGRGDLKGGEMCYAEECIHAASDIIKHMDPSANPCEDFYQYACGRWKQFNSLSPDMSALDTLTILKNDMRKVFKDLLEAPIAKNDSRSTRQAKQLYRSCLNETNVERLKEKPLLNLFKDIGLTWPVLDTSNKTLDKFDEDTFDWMTVVIKLRRMKLDTLFASFVGADQKNSSVNIIQLDQLDPMVPSVDLGSPRGKRQIEAYHSMMVFAAEMMGANRTKALQEMKDVVMFEIRMRSFLDPADKRRNFTTLYNRMTLEQLEIALPDMKWTEYLTQVFKQQFTQEEPLVVYSFSFLNKLNELIKNTPKRTVANFICWRVVYYFMFFLDKRFVNLRQRYTNIITGTSHPVPRWRTCVTLVNNNMGLATGAMFLKRHYSTNIKLAADDMIRDIRDSFLEELNNVDWMDDITKSIAKEKTKLMESKVSFPLYILDAEKLDKEYQTNYTEDDCFGNVLLSNEYRYAKELAKVGKPNDKKIWLTAPGTVNAFYTRTGNFITLPAAILQPPLFHPSYPLAKNYGGIGVVIGHEITHGFDDKGRQFNQFGNLLQWWHPETLNKFKRKAQCMIDQYSQYIVPEVNIKVNGYKTQGENIADNGGIKHAYKAYRKRQNSVHLPVRKLRLPGVNLTDDQLFFLTYAQIWCGSATLERINFDVRYSDHAPPRFRVIGALSNSEEFAEAFECPSGSSMNPTQKCKVW